MTTETARPGSRAPATMRLPVSFDDMTVGEFLDVLQWWATLTTTERQAVLAARNETRH